MGLINHTFTCFCCHTPMTTQTIRCPNPVCGCDYGYISQPTSPEGIAKKEKHEELVTVGSLSYGDGPGKFNASFDYVGVASKDKLVRFALAFGHRTQVSSGPGRAPSDVALAYVPEIIGSGVATFWSGYQACSGICVISPASEKWAHPFPAMDSWIKQKDPGLAWTCATCPRAVPFGHVFCGDCYARHGSDWRTFMV